MMLFNVIYCLVLFWMMFWLFIVKFMVSGSKLCRFNGWIFLMLCLLIWRCVV